MPTIIRFRFNHKMPSTSPSRQNNFDFLRVLAALLVLFGHQLALSGQPEITIFPHLSVGTFAVFVFFSISGFLISASWRSDPQVWRFVAKRFLRIWPGFAVVTLLAAFVMGPLVSIYSMEEYFSSPRLYHYLHNLRMSIQYDLPGVFQTNPYPHAVNGSMWTIPLEIRCYLLLLLVGLVRLIKFPSLVFGMTLLFCADVFIFNTVNAPMAWHFIAFFFVGVSLDLYRAWWLPHSRIIFVGLLAIAAILVMLRLYELALLMVLPLASIWFGLQSFTGFNAVGKFGDMSYGLYLYAFPVQQLFFYLQGVTLPFWLGLAVTTLTTVFCAYLSWHLIERPALRLKTYILP